MPITIERSDHPEHIVRVDAVSDPNRVLINCSCGEDMSIVSDKDPDTAIETFEAVSRHLDGIEHE